ncbi:MAG: ferritin-like domain-containing protein [Gemmatimonadota bacterium]
MSNWNPDGEDRQMREFLAKLSQGTDRRRFLKWSGLSVGALAVGCGDDDDDDNGTGPPDGDPVVTLPLRNTTDVLKFALFLELLEADFYTQAVASGALSGTVLEIATSVRDHEQDHVDALQGLLGSMAFDEDDVEFDFGNAVENQTAFLPLAETLEQTGTQAYLGALPIIGERQNRLTAGTIATIEARHTSVFRALNGRPDPVPRAFEVPLTPEQVIAAVRALNVVERGL